MIPACHPQPIAHLPHPNGTSAAAAPSGSTSPGSAGSTRSPTPDSAYHTPSVISPPMNPRPIFTPPNVKPKADEVKMPPGRPSDAHKAERVQEDIDALRRLYRPSHQSQLNEADVNLARDGVIPPFPTDTRAPTREEIQMAQAFAQRMRSHVHGPNQTTFDRNVKYGEFGATFHLAKDSTGATHVKEHSFGYDPGGRFAFDYKQPGAGDSRRDGHYPNYPKPSEKWHSHPTLRTLDQTLRRPATANTMPSAGDLALAARDYEDHGGNHYMVWGNEVRHYTGKDMKVTNLVPSPMEGLLPPARTPLHPNYPADQLPPQLPHSAAGNMTEKGAQP